MPVFGRKMDYVNNFVCKNNTHIGGVIGRIIKKPLKTKEKRMWKTLWIMWITNRRIIMREILCKFVGEGRMLVWRRKRAEKVSFFSCDFDERCERMGEKGQRKGKISAKDGA